jgi:glycosyltransferase involved in cell wall biosynthesis
VRRLREVLAALAWCEEVVVLDTGSTDATLAIAGEFSNVVVHRLQGPFPGFGRARRHAISLARHDWILSIDSDEVLSPELIEEICDLELDSNAVYALPFRNHFNGRHITTCGWAPDFHERLFDRRKTGFCQSDVHERVRTTDLAIRRLRHPVDHYSYGCLQDLLRKMNTYATLFARENVAKKSAGPAKAIGRSAWAFFKSYALQRGMFQGREGLIISVYKAQTVFWKYVMLDDANARHRERMPEAPR